MESAPQHLPPQVAPVTLAGRPPPTELGALPARQATSPRLEEIASASPLLLKRQINILTTPCCTACDPSCASCSGSSGTCLTCQAGLQPLSTDATKCTTATFATTDGTFITCADRTYFDSTTSACVDCNPLCETCWTTGSSGCLSCRSPNALLNGECVALNSKTGVCDSSGVVQDGSTTAVASNAGWVLDNSKSECDGELVLSRAR